MTIQAVLFDMGGTIDTYRYTREYRLAKICLMRDCLTRAGIDLSFTDEQLVDAIASGAAEYLRWNLNLNIELKPEEIWSRFFLKGQQISAEALAPIGEELAFLYETQLFIREPRQEALQVLEKIKSLGLKTGCISNTQSLTQVPNSLKEYGLADYFYPVVLSSAYGRRKPDPSIFHFAAQLANVPTGACVYVGDKINRDILGAHRAGFHLAVQIKHEYDRGEKDEGSVPDAAIHSLNELIPILEAELAQNRVQQHVVHARKIKALFFDAGDVLYHRPDRDKNLRMFLERNKFTPPAHFFEERLRLKDLAFTGKISRHDYYQQLVSLCGADTDEVLAEGVAAMDLDDNTIELMPGVPETLLDLKEKGFILGIITNTAISVSRKLNWFEQHGFGRVWDAFISSKEMGQRKPSPALYEKAIQQSGVCACETVFIGHDQIELNGAQAVGMKTVAYNYPPGVIADYYIQSFCDLLNMPLLIN